jgi:hypothetical protein
VRSRAIDGSILYLTEVPPDGGGDTMFANMYLAYDMLSEPIRSLIDGLTAIHDGEKHYRGRYGNDDRGKTYPRAEHPIVRTHPETGRKCLFVNRLPRALSACARAKATRSSKCSIDISKRPELSVRFKWQPNSVAFWDNRGTQHAIFHRLVSSDRFGDDQTARSRQRRFFNLLPSGLSKPGVGFLLAIGLALAGDDEELSGYQSGRTRLGVTRIGPHIDEQQPCTRLHACPHLAQQLDVVRHREDMGGVCDD